MVDRLESLLTHFAVHARMFHSGALCGLNEVPTLPDAGQLHLIKLGPVEARIEVEEATAPELFESLWPLTRRARVRKDRFTMPEGNHHWEIDVFLDRQLVLAEIELQSMNEVITPPAWLAPYIVRDVTGESAYFNSELARPDA